MRRWITASMPGAIGSGAAASLAVSKSVQSALQAKLTSATGVSVDAELATMVRLQNAYAANAKVMSAADGMWQQVIGLVK